MVVVIELCLAGEIGLEFEIFVDFPGVAVEEEKFEVFELVLLGVAEVDGLGLEFLAFAGF